MTSVKSSADTFWFTFIRTLRKTFVVPLALCAFMTYMFSDIFSVISGYKYDLAHTKGFNAEEFLAARKFIIMNINNMDYGFESIATEFLIVVASVILAIQIFRFVASKKSVNVYYSLGVTRENMFISKYLCGAAMLMIALLIPVLVSLFGNIYFFGSSRELFISIFYYYFEYFVTALFCYSATALVMSCVGSVFEAAVCSGIVILIPTIINLTIEGLMSAFLYGAPYGHQYYILNQESQQAQTLSALKMLNPFAVTFNGDFESSYSYILTDYTNPASHSWVQPSFSHALIWGIITVAVFFAGLLIFKNRKAEHSGFLGVCRPLTVICTFSVGLLITSYIVGRMENYKQGVSLLSAILIGSLVMFILYSAAKLILFRSFRGYIKKLYLVLPYCAVFGLICVIFSTGLVGYSSRLPSESDIKSVSVTTGTANNIVNPYNCGINDFSYADDYDKGERRESGFNAMRSVTLTSYGTTLIPGFTSSNDINVILNAHRILIDNKNLSLADAEQGTRETVIYFRYELKDGTVFERKYELATNEVLRLLTSLQSSKVYTDLMIDKLSEPADIDKEEEGDAPADLYSSGDNTFSNRSFIGLISSNLISRTKVKELSESMELRAQMINALRSDIAAGRAHTDLLSDKPALGFICAYEENLNFENRTDFKDGDTKAFFLSGFYGSECIPVYSSMTSTVDFLTKNNLIDLFSDTTAPKSVKVFRVEDVKFNKEEMFWDNFTTQISGCVYYESTGINTIFPTDAKEITDPTKVKQIYDNTRYSCSSAESGVYVELIYDNGVTAYGYLPIRYLPE